MDVLEELKSLKDEEYKEFNQKIIPTNQKMLGVRLPALRKIAKRIANNGWEDFIEVDKKGIYEMIFLQGLAISYIKKPFIEVVPLIERYLEDVDNWAQVDSVIMGFKGVKDKDILLETAKKWLESDKEFVVRSGLILILSTLVDREYLKIIFGLSNEVEHKGYYVFMGNAWLISVCMAKYPEETIEFFKDNRLDDQTHNKAIQKSCESYRVSKEDKKLIRGLKRS